MSAELQITDERLALIATQGVSMQVWEQRIVAAECLAHRIANKGGSSRKSTVLPVDPTCANKGQSESP